MVAKINIIYLMSFTHNYEKYFCTKKILDHIVLYNRNIKIAIHKNTGREYRNDYCE